jgi:hypothetical protein
VLDFAPEAAARHVRTVTQWPVTQATVTFVAFAHERQLRSGCVHVRR